MAFRCQACGERVLAEWSGRPAWARVAGFDGAEWADLLAGVPAGGVWPRLETTPTVGAEYMLSVGPPLTVSPGRPFWVLFQPALSALNGWDEHPEEIPASALVQLDLVEVLEQRETGGWLRVRAREVIGVAELPSRFEESSAGPAAPRLEGSIDRGQRVDRGAFSYLAVNRQGDTGAWAICLREGPTVRLLLYGEWGMHEDYVFAGNRPLLPEEWRSLSP